MAPTSPRAPLHATNDERKPPSSVHNFIRSRDSPPLKAEIEGFRTSANGASQNYERCRTIERGRTSLDQSHFLVLPPKHVLCPIKLRVGEPSWILSRRCRWIDILQAANQVRVRTVGQHILNPIFKPETSSGPRIGVMAGQWCSFCGVYRLGTAGGRGLQ